MEFKYRTFSAQHLDMLRSKTLYFASPAGFNDPFDCRLDISTALSEAESIARKQFDKTSAAKLRTLALHPTLFQKIETDIANTGVLSLSRTSDCVLMWSHYADDHRGFCVGLDLNKRLGTYNEAEKIVGKSSVTYYRRNPYLKFFREFFHRKSGYDYTSFWQEALVHGLVSKSSPWRYENETRIIRVEPGPVDLHPDEIKEVTFGLRTSTSDESLIRSILSGPAFSHVKYKRIVRKGASFKFYRAPA